MARLDAQPSGRPQLDRDRRKGADPRVRQRQVFRPDRIALTGWGRRTFAENGLMMTRDRDVKNLVRARMAQTGETYTAARAALLATGPEPEHQPDHRPDHRPDPAADAFRAKTLRAFFDGPRLRSIPAKRKARVIVLLELLNRFEAGRVYPEHEVNEILGAAYEDFASLRRELVDYRYLVRADARYWVCEEAPERDANEAQEVPSDEVARLHAMGVLGGCRARW